MAYVQLPILVSYSTRTGSTGEVAEFIAEVLREAQVPVEVARMRDLKTFTQYKAAILGAPLYMRGMPGEVSRFLHRHRHELAALPTWVFILGPVRGLPWEFRQAGEKAGKQLERTHWFHPAEVKVVGGRLDVNNLPFPLNLAQHLPVPGKDLPPTDVRNWDDIRAWTSTIADKLGLTNGARNDEASVLSAI